MYEERIRAPLTPPPLLYHPPRVLTLSLVLYFVFNPDSDLLWLHSYAIKKVVFRGVGVSHPRAQAVMREVQCLAQLDHRNVVRYHTSWLESSWVENGMGRTSGASPTGAAGGFLGIDVKRSPTAARGVRDLSGIAAGIRSTLPHGTVRALGASSAAGTSEDGGDMSVRARLDALVPANMQPQLIRGLESMIRANDSASESSQSGWGLGVDSEASGGGGGGGAAGMSDTAWRNVHLRSGATTRRWRGNSLLRGNGGGWGDGFQRGSLSPRRQSPRSPLCPFPATTPRDRGFSRWSAEDAESETSRWSDAESLATGNRVDFGDDVGAADRSSIGGTGELVSANTSSSGGGAAGVRTTVGVPASASPAKDCLEPMVLHHPHTFRHPSIDLDDLVSFGKSAGTEDGTAPHESGEASYDERRDGWREMGAAPGAPGNMGHGGRGRNRRDAHGGGSGGRHRAKGWAPAQARRSVSPDGVIHYPVTLYIQMTLCPGDTLQDWMRKRNARLASEAEDRCSSAGAGVLIEQSATESADENADTPSSSVFGDTYGRRRGEPRQASCSDSDGGGGDDDVLSVLHENPSSLPSPLHAGNGRGEHDDDVVAKPLQTPATSPRTDPATSESSQGESDGTPSEGCCSNSASTQGGMLCPPPTRETSCDLPCGFSSTAHGGRERAGGKARRTSSPASPAVSASCSRASGTEVECEWTGDQGSGRVDLHESLRLFRQLVDGVAHVHSKGIIHRDLKVHDFWSCALCWG